MSKRLLCACEESQVVTLAFRDLGYEAFSCDIQSCSGGFPEYHIQDDVRSVLSFHWDLVIAFPPCTYLTNASACRMFPGGTLNMDRYELAMAARDFFMMFYELECPHAIENPLPLSIVDLPPYDQIVQPYMFGHPFSKRTCLWLHKLPPLMGTCLCMDYEPFILGSHDPRSSKGRSRTFEGLGMAMASQWGYILD